MFDVLFERSIVRSFNEGSVGGLELDRGGYREVRYGFFFWFSFSIFFVGI